MRIRPPKVTSEEGQDKDQEVVFATDEQVQESLKRSLKKYAEMWRRLAQL